MASALAKLIVLHERPQRPRFPLYDRLEICAHPVGQAEPRRRVERGHDQLELTRFRGHPEA